MRSRSRSFAVLAVVAVVASARSTAQATHQEFKPHLYAPLDMTFGKGPASLPAGAQVVVLEGNPAEPGPFTMRFKLPAGYRVPPHFHPGLEHVTVIQGTFLVGVGEKEDPAAMKALSAGGFMVTPPGQKHFVRAQGETVIQVHGVGPWGITYVNPADDPRGQAKPDR